MKLHEYQAKELFKKYNLPVQEGYVIKDASEIKTVQEPVVLKAQILVGGRGKAGGIKFAKTTDEAKNIAKEILSAKIKGCKVEQILVSTAVDIQKEYYVGYTIDRESKKITLILSLQGGINIEEVAKTNPDAIYKLSIDPRAGVELYQIRDLVAKMGVKGKELNVMAAIAHTLYKIVVDYDVELTEINPVATTPQGLVAVDAVLNVDDNALYRHKDLHQWMSESDEYTEIEKKAKDADLAYVELEGDVAIIGCGAGLVMASLDAINTFGGKPANFLDVGGGANAANMQKALDIVLMKPEVKSIFINIFGGITRCDEIAKGIIAAQKKVPVAIRMMGTNEEEGKCILADNKLEVFDTMEEAAKRAVELAQGA